MAERLTPRTPDPEVWGSSLARRNVSLDKERIPLCFSLPWAELFKAGLS